MRRTHSLSSLLLTVAFVQAAQGIVDWIFINQPLNDNISTTNEFSWQVVLGSGDRATEKAYVRGDNSILVKSNASPRDKMTAAMILYDFNNFAVAYKIKVSSQTAPFCFLSDHNKWFVGTVRSLALRNFTEVHVTPPHFLRARRRRLTKKEVKQLPPAIRTFCPLNRIVKTEKASSLTRSGNGRIDVNIKVKRLLTLDDQIYIFVPNLKGKGKAPFHSLMSNTSSSIVGNNGNDMHNFNTGWLFTNNIRPGISPERNDTGNFPVPAAMLARGPSLLARLPPMGSVEKSNVAGIENEDKNTVLSTKGDAAHPESRGRVLHSGDKRDVTDSGNIRADSASGMNHSVSESVVKTSGTNSGIGKPLSGPGDVGSLSGIARPLSGSENEDSNSASGGSITRPISNMVEPIAPKDKDSGSLSSVRRPFPGSGEKDLEFLSGVGRPLSTSGGKPLRPLSGDGRPMSVTGNKDPDSVSDGSFIRHISTVVGRSPASGDKDSGSLSGIVRQHSQVGSFEHTFPPVNTLPRSILRSFPSGMGFGNKEALSGSGGEKDPALLPDEQGPESVLVNLGNSQVSEDKKVESESGQEQPSPISASETPVEALQSAALDPESKLKESSAPPGSTNKKKDKSSSIRNKQKKDKSSDSGKKKKEEKSSGTGKKKKGETPLSPANKKKKSSSSSSGNKNKMKEGTSSSSANKKKKGNTSDSGKKKKKSYLSGFSKTRQQ